MAKITSAFYIQYEYLNTVYEFKTELHCSIIDYKDTAKFSIKVTNDMKENLVPEFIDEIKNAKFDNPKEIDSWFLKTHAKFVVAKPIKEEFILMYEGISTNLDTFMSTKFTISPKYILIKKTTLEDNSFLIHDIDSTTTINDEAISCHGDWYRKDFKCDNETSLQSRYLHIINMGGNEQFDIIYCDENFINIIKSKCESINQYLTKQIKILIDSIDNVLNNYNVDQMLNMGLQNFTLTMDSEKEIE